MKNLIKNTLTRIILLSIGIALFSLISSCSNNNNRINTLQEVQTGTVVAVKRSVVKSEAVKPRGNLGVSVGSSGRAGLYGAVDILTLGSLFGIKKSDKVFEKITIKRSNGTLVAVTQPYSASFNRGDQVKIIQRGNEARVTH